MTDWETVHWARNYAVSSDGRVRNCNTGRELRPWLRFGYPEVALRSKGKSRYVRVHRLVLEAFVALKPTGMEACHADGNRSNNCVANLRWDTHKNNALDMSRHHRCRTKMTDEQVIEIVKAKPSCRKEYQVFMDKFDVSLSTVEKARRGFSYKHIDRSKYV